MAEKKQRVELDNHELESLTELVWSSVKDKTWESVEGKPKEILKELTLLIILVKLKRAHHRLASRLPIG